MMIETERLIVRLFREEDADALYRIKTDPQVMKYCPDFLDVEAKQADMLDYIHTFRKIEEDGDTDTWRCYAIENRETGEVKAVLMTGPKSIMHFYGLPTVTVTGGRYHEKDVHTTACIFGTAFLRLPFTCGFLLENVLEARRVRH